MEVEDFVRSIGAELKIRGDEYWICSEKPQKFVVVVKQNEVVIRRGESELKLKGNVEVRIDRGAISDDYISLSTYEGKVDSAISVRVNTIRIKHVNSYKGKIEVDFIEPWLKNSKKFFNL